MATKTPPPPSPPQKKQNLPPSVEKAKEIQKQKDISTGRATQVTISQGKITSAKNVMGQSVSTDVAVAASPSEKITNETATTPTSRGEFIQNILQKQENLKAKAAGTEARQVTVAGVSEVAGKTSINYVAAPSSAVVNQRVVNELAAEKAQKEITAQQRGQTVQTQAQTPRTQTAPIKQDYSKLGQYERKAEALSREEKAYFQGDIFQDLQSFSNKVTFGGGIPIEQRDFLGQYAEMGVSSLISSPYAVVGTGYYGLKKVTLGIEGLGIKETRKEVLKEFFYTAPKEVLKSDTFNPTKPAGALTYTFAFAGGAIDAALAVKGMKAAKSASVISTKGEDIVSSPIEFIKEGKATPGTHTVMEGINKVEIRQKPNTFFTKVGNELLSQLDITQRYTGEPIVELSSPKGKIVTYTVNVRGVELSFPTKNPEISVTRGKVGFDIAGKEIKGIQVSRGEISATPDVTKGRTEFVNIINTQKKGFIEQGMTETISVPFIEENGLKTTASTAVSQTSRLIPFKTKSSTEIINAFDYATKLNKEEIIEFKTSENLGGDLGHFIGGENKKIKIDSSLIIKGGENPVYDFMETIGHEIVHLEQSERGQRYAYELPHDLRPSEIEALAREKNIAKAGFEVEAVKISGINRLSNKLSKQSPSSVEAGIIKDIKIAPGELGDITTSQAKFTELQNRKAAESFIKDITSEKITPKSESISAGERLRLINKGNSAELLSKIKTVSKSAAKVAYLEEVIKPQRMAAVTSIAIIGASSRNIMKQIGRTDLKQNSNISQDVKQIQKSMPKSRESQQNEIKITPVSGQKQDQNNIIKINQGTINIQKPISEQKQQQEQIQKPIQLTKQKQKANIITTPPPPIEPTKTRIHFPFGGRLGEGKRKKRFFAKVRRRGKFITVGNYETEVQAFSAGKKNVLQTLGASFKVVGEGGEGISAPKFDNRFYMSKREAGVIIQKREFRLGSMGEKKEIRQSKFKSMLGKIRIGRLF
jgi:hypothetical protein